MIAARSVFCSFLNYDLTCFQIHFSSKCRGVCAYLTLFFSIEMNLVSIMLDSDQFRTNVFPEVTALQSKLIKPQHTFCCYCYSHTKKETTKMCFKSGKAKTALHFCDNVLLFGYVTQPAL